MVEVTAALRLAAGALGTVGAVLLFVEFFQVPSYVDYNAQMGSYSFTLSPTDVREHTWFGRAGALLLALAFALQFFSVFL
ncbi:MAG: hypothetical protein ABEH77_09395 [Halobacteriaceae archaeon]